MTEPDLKARLAQKSFPGYDEDTDQTLLLDDGDTLYVELDEAERICQEYIAEHARFEVVQLQNDLDLLAAERDDLSERLAALTAKVEQLQAFPGMDVASGYAVVNQVLYDELRALAAAVSGGVPES